MEFIEETLEMRGMKRIEIINYFLGIGGKAMNEENFIGNGWEVQVEQEKLVSIGSLKIPATIVTFRCEKELIVQMLATFRLRFLSAGG